MSKDNLKITISFPSIGKKVETDTDSLSEISKNIKKLIPKMKSKEYAYKMGVDCAKNGENLENCNFSIFSSKENMKAWEKGLKDGKK